MTEVPSKWNRHLRRLRSGPLSTDRERVTYALAFDHVLDNPKVRAKLGKRPSASAGNVRRAVSKPVHVRRVLDESRALLQDFREAEERHTEAEEASDEAWSHTVWDWRLSCLGLSLFLFLGSLANFGSAPDAVTVFVLLPLTLLALVVSVTSPDTREHAGNLMALAARAYAFSRAGLNLKRRQKALTQQWRVVALPMTLSIVDELLGEDRDSLYLPTGNAGLYSTRNSAYVVESAASVQLKRKIEQIDDGTIAICGARGTGKTTLLEEAADGAGFSVLVQVPATYTPHDFLLHLSAKVCETYIQSRFHPVPSFGSLGLIRRPLQHLARAARRFLRWAAFAGLSAGLVVLGVAWETGNLMSAQGSDALDEISNGLGWLRDYGEQIWHGERPVVGLALAAGGVLLWQRRKSAKFRRSAVQVGRLAVRVVGLALVVATCATLYFDPGVRANAALYWQNTGLIEILFVFVGYPMAVRGIFRKHLEHAFAPGPLGRPEPGARETAWLLLLFVGFLVWSKLIVSNEGLDGILFDDDNGIRLVLSSLGVFLFHLDMRTRNATPHLVARCQQHLYRLRTLQNASAMVSLGMPDKLGASQTTSLSLAPLTFPEIVSDFRDILRSIAHEHAALGRQERLLLDLETGDPDAGASPGDPDAGTSPGDLSKVVIAIDELDRIGSEEQALAFLREVKAIFGVRGVCYLISVAEDVGAAFLRRGLPHRDVTESSLDDVLYVHPCGLKESTAVLHERVPGLTAPYVCLAHALSGGLPRDLIRYGRRLDEVQRETKAYEMPLLAWELITDEIGEALASTRVLLADEPGWTAENSTVLLHLNDLVHLLSGDIAADAGARTAEQASTRVLMSEFANRRVRPMRAWTVSSAQPWPADQGLSEQTRTLLEEASTLVHFGLTLLDIFAAPDFNTRKEEADAESARGESVHPLAGARRELSISPHSARVLIDDIRKAWDLDPW
ncbi:hypothetical protein ACIBKX_08800 [Streptomyces sp. NPDC050658]|uniref:hypothetical protein n=1 Tax=unclassified Streptomyces TaxID=2593676 RepID=UPI003431946A